MGQIITRDSDEIHPQVPQLADVEAQSALSILLPPNACLYHNVV